MKTIHIKSALIAAVSVIGCLSPLARAQIYMNPGATGIERANNPGLNDAAQSIGMRQAEARIDRLERVAKAQANARNPHLRWLETHPTRRS